MADQTQSPGTAGESTRLDRADWLSFAATTLLVLTGYLLTLAPSITLAWSGILTTTAMYGGVGPPQGYPVWTIYSWLFIKLIPFSNPAWRVAVGSAVAGALACGLVALMVSRSGKILFGSMPAFERLTSRRQKLVRGFAGYVAGMALGFSGSLWNEALIQDFATLTVLLFALMICVLIRWMETGRRRLCWLAFFVYGLLLTNGQDMITALPGLTCAIIFIDRKFGRDLSLVILPLGVLTSSFTQFSVWEILYYRVNWPLLIIFAAATLIAIGAVIATRGIASEWKSALACGLCMLLGLATYLYLPVVSMTNPPVNWGYARTTPGFIHLITREQYEKIPWTSEAFSAGQVWTLVKQIGHGALVLLKQMGRQFGWLYLAFATFSFCFIRRATGLGRRWLIGLLAVSVCIGPVLFGLLSFTGEDRQSQGLVEFYFFPLRVLLALWTGAGLILFATIVATPRPDKSSTTA